MASNGLGIVYMGPDRLEEAASLFEEAIRADPYFGHAHYHLGLTLLRLGRADEAARELKEAENLLPGEPKVLKALRKAQRAQAH